jgi:hypothetical protein
MEANAHRPMDDGEDVIDNEDDDIMAVDEQERADVPVQEASRNRKSTKLLAGQAQRQAARARLPQPDPAQFEPFFPAFDPPSSEDKGTPVAPFPFAFSATHVFACLDGLHMIHLCACCHVHSQRPAAPRRSHFRFSRPKQPQPEPLAHQSFR